MKIIKMIALLIVVVYFLYLGYAERDKDDAFFITTIVLSTILAIDVVKGVFFNSRKG